MSEKDLLLGMALYLTLWGIAIGLGLVGLWVMP